MAEQDNKKFFLRNKKGVLIRDISTSLLVINFHDTFVSRFIIHSPTNNKMRASKILGP